MDKEYKNLVLECQNCKKDFVIEPDDFSFYEKIKVPPPTFCPECRMIRRMVWRNHRCLNKRNCNSCNKSLISMYNDEAPVYCNECWFSDKRDQFKYGVEYNFTKPFFEQWKNLLKINPRLYAYRAGNSIDSEYVNFSLDIKNVYLSYSIVDCEDILYSEAIDKSKKVLDSYSSHNLDNCYYNIDSKKNYDTCYAIKSSSCINCLFIFDCVNCQDCVLSSNLRNKRFFYRNKQYSKEEYEKLISGLKLNTHIGISDCLKDFESLIKSKETIHRFANIISSQNVSGDNIENCKNVKLSFNMKDTEDTKYSWRTMSNTKDSFDVQSSVTGELLYESIAVSFNSYKVYFCHIATGCRECEYGFNLKNCKNCFGCMGLVNASYCILKQTIY
jgi:hypothetical protein